MSLNGRRRPTPALRCLHQGRSIRVLPGVGGCTVDDPSARRLGRRSLGVTMPVSKDAQRLARRLRELRESRDPTLTQAELARSLSGTGRIAPTTISSWESLTNPKLPPRERLRAYAL